MKLIKVKGIIIKEVNYQDNDKIITILTDELGKVSCMAKGSRKINSPILANSQYLVYSEFVLFKGSKFYYVNSADIINTFYKLRTDFDKLQTVFELTKLLFNVTDENQDTKNILKLFLNTIYIIDTMDIKVEFIIAIFKIKLLSLLGFAPRMDKCSCKESFFDELNKNEFIYYDCTNNVFLCENCAKKENNRKFLKINNYTYIAIKYVMNAEIKKIFNFKLKDSNEFEIFSKVYLDNITNGI